MTHETLFDSSEITLNMGPQHPSTHGVLQVKLKLDGEKVIDAECVIGFLHRGVEKLGENQTFGQFLPTLDRMDYIASVSNCLGYAEAIEKMLGVEAPPRAQYVRVILTELNRITSHLLWLGTHALDIGAMTVFLYCFREREEILKIFENYCGARLTTHVFRIGGLQYEIYDGFEDEVRAFINDFPKKVDEYEQLLTENRIWLGRTRGVGVLTKEEAIDMGVTGPCLRASGVSWDIRKSNPYAAYADFDFDVPVGEYGDTYGHPDRLPGCGEDPGRADQGEGREDPQAGCRGCVSCDRSAKRGVGVLRGCGRLDPTLPRSRASALIHQPPGVAPDGEGAHGG